MSPVTRIGGGISVASRGLVLAGAIRVGAVGGVAGPTIYGSDSFVDTPATLLTAHTATQGGPWLANGVSSATHQISNADRARLSANTGTGIHYLSAAVPPSADYEVSAPLHFLTNVGSVYGITGRYSTTVDTGYSLRRVVSTNLWQLIRLNAGAVTSLGSTAGLALTASQTYQMTLRMVGANITALIDNVIVLGPVTDGSPISGIGIAGLRSSASGGTVGDAAGMHFADFTVRSVT